MAGEQVPVGRAAFDGAGVPLVNVNDNSEGSGKSGDAQVQNPTISQQDKNPFAAQATPGSSLESEDSLIARLKGGRGATQKPAATIPGAQATGGNLAAAKPATSPDEAQRTLQAENDRLKARLRTLEPDAVLGQKVRSDPKLHQMALSAEQNAAQYPAQAPIVTRDQFVMGPQVNPGAQTIEQMLGLPADFEPIVSEMSKPGSDSWRWNQAQIRLAAAELIQEREQKSRVEDRVERERQAFMDSGHSENDLQWLLEWIQQRANFTLGKLWDYAHLGETVQNVAADTQKGAAGIKEFTGSIAAVAGEAGTGGEELPPEVQVQVDLLDLARQNRNPQVYAPRR